MTLGFTGTSSGMTPAQERMARRLAQTLPLTELHHGDCVGADAQMHRIARHLRAHIFVHPPTDPKHRAFCLGYDHIYEPYPYLLRNRHIISRAIDGVIATPKDFIQPTNLRGQGTWTTIGYARQAKRHLWIVFPDGTVKEEVQL